MMWKKNSLKFIVFSCSDLEYLNTMHNGYIHSTLHRYKIKVKHPSLTPPPPNPNSPTIIVFLLNCLYVNVDIFVLIVDINVQ